MGKSIRWLVIVTAILVLPGQPWSEQIQPDEQAPVKPHGACYLWFHDMTECVGEVSESECQERCDYLLCDRYGWLDRRPCWNWGYGG